MATTDWKELLAIAQGANGNQVQQPDGVKPAAQQTKSTDVGSLVQKVDPSKITQSYYKTPVNSGNYESGRPVYEQSQAVQDAAGALQQHQQNKPGEFVSTWNDEIQSMINEALNRPKFNYDFTEDPVYQMYADKYQTMGRHAMKGAMGESAALTGGYGNSYAQQAGQQAYQNYMLGLNDMIPTLRDQSYQQYKDEGDTLRENLSMLQTEDEREYGRYRDTVGDWRDDLNYLYTAYSDMSQQEYQRYMNDQAAWEADRAYWYQKAYDEQQQRNWEKEFAAKYGDGSGGSGGGNGGSKKKKTTTKVTNAALASAVAGAIARANGGKK